MITLFIESNDKSAQLIIQTSIKDDVTAVCKGYEILRFMPDMDKFCLYRKGKQISVWMAK